MGMIVLLLDEGADVASIDASTARRLLDLGITNVSLSRDDSTVSLVLDGWAFDPARSGASAAAIFGASRVLLPVFQTVLAPDTSLRQDAG